MKEILISIIVPIYNVESKINKLLNSLYKIKNKNIEIILVDNNSIDRSLDIIKKYSMKDKRVKVYKEFKKGANYARLLGYNKSNGKYIYFIDSDDYIESNTFNNIINTIKHNKPDVLIGNYNELDSNYKFIKLMHGFGENNILLYKPSLWNKIFKRELIKKENFIFTEIGEDMYITLPILANTKNIYFFNKPIYNYVRDNNSISNKNNYKVLHNCVETLKLLKDKFIKDNTYNVNKDEIDYVLITHSFYRGFKGMLLNKTERNKVRKETLSFVKELNYKKNKYYKKSNIYKLVNILISSKMLYNLLITRIIVNLLFNNKLFNKILKKIDK